MALMTPKFGAKKIDPGTGRLVQNVGKGHQLLPHKDAVNRLTKGSPEQQSFLSYAKETPSGRNAPQTYGDILDMATLGVSAKP